jgi:hypothetical protein
MYEFMDHVEDFTSLGGIVMVVSLLFALTVVMTLLFTVIPDNASGQKCRTVMMMPLQFAYKVVTNLFALTAVVITYMFSISTARGCTSGNDFARMFVLVPPITIGFSACILGIVFEDMVAGKDSGLLVVMLLLFALTAVMLADVISSQKCGIVLVVPYLWMGRISCWYNLSKGP